MTASPQPATRDLLDLAEPETFRDAVAFLFKSKPNEWISAEVLMRIGGRMAWRTRVSDCRRELGMCIENRVRKVEAGYKVSEYRWVKP